MANTLIDPKTIGKKSKGGRPKGAKTDPEKLKALRFRRHRERSVSALPVGLLKAGGLSVEEIGKLLKIGSTAVYERLNELGERLPTGEELTVANKIMQDLLKGSMFNLLLEANDPEKLQKMGVRDASVSFGILFDKMRLLQGESTANVSLAEFFQYVREKGKEGGNEDSKVGGERPGPVCEVPDPTSDRLLALGAGKLPHDLGTTSPAGWENEVHQTQEETGPGVEGE